MKKPVLLGALSMVGTIVGAGIFGLPYVFAQAGVGLSLVYCVVLGAAAVLTHWLYARVVNATAGKHRLVGYVQKHLGRREAGIASITNPMNLLGSLLAYLILGGTFCAAIFGGSAVVWGLIFFAVMSVMLFLPFRRAEYFEGALTWLLIAVAVVIVTMVAPHMRIENISMIDTSKWLLPYGVIFFSFGGLSVVPDIVESLGNNMKRARSAIVLGTIISIIISAAFGLAIAATTGSLTANDAISSLVPVLGRSIVALGAIFGILAVATSFLTIGENMKEQFQLDFKMSNTTAWSATIGIPLAAFVFGARDFIGVIGFIGAVFGVIDGILIALMARKIVKGRLRVVTIPLIVLFVAGLASELFLIFK